VGIIEGQEFKRVLEVTAARISHVTRKLTRGPLAVQHENACQGRHQARVFPGLVSIRINRAGHLVSSGGRMKLQNQPGSLMSTTPKTGGFGQPAMDSAA